MNLSSENRVDRENMSRLPRVSAIITAFNGGPFIADAIESVLAQSMPVHELFVIDDGSTDETFAIVEPYIELGVRLIRQENRGIAGARNRGIAESTGDLIAFLDCDDLWAPEKTAVQVQHLIEKPDTGLVTCDIWWWDVQTNQRQMKQLPIGSTQAAIRRRLAIRNYIGNASGVLIPRRVLEAVGNFDPKQIWAEDWDLWVRIAERFPISIIRRPLMVYRGTSISVTTKNLWARSQGYYEQARRVIRSRPVFWRPLLILHAWGWREYFRTLCARNERMSRGRYLLHAVLALISWPFEETRSKFGHCARALLGERIFAWYQAFRARSGLQPGTG